MFPVHLPLSVSPPVPAPNPVSTTGNGGHSENKIKIIVSKRTYVSIKKSKYQKVQISKIKKQKFEIVSKVAYVNVKTYLFQSNRTHDTKLTPHPVSACVPVFLRCFQCIAIHVGGGKQCPAAWAHDPLPKHFFRFYRTDANFTTKGQG